MRLLVSTHSDNEHFNADCDYAIVDLTPELARTIAARRRLHLETRLKDEKLSSLEFADDSVTYYRYLEGAYPDALDIIEEHFRQDNDTTEIPDGLDLKFLDEEKDEDGEYVHRADNSSVLIIHENCFYWVRYGEACYVETTLFSYNLLTKLI